MLTISILNNTNWKFVHHKVDRIINLCGPGPRGTGLQNLREAIIQTKWKYDLAMEDKQVQDDIVCSLTRNIHRKAGEHAFLASWNGNFFQNLYIFLLYTSTKCLLKLSSTMDITITALNSLVAKLIDFENKVLLPDLLCYLRQRVWAWRIWKEFCDGELF